jgi:hypothetical protein
MTERDAVAKAALPYCHERVPDAVVDGRLSFNIGRLSTVGDILEAQRKVAQAMADGHMSLPAGKQWLESLAILAKTYDTAVLADRVAELEDNAKAYSRDPSAPSLVVIDGDLPS